MKYHKLKACEIPGTYEVTSSVTEEDLVKMAQQVMLKRLSRGSVFTEPKRVGNYLQMKFGSCEREVFSVMFLDNRHRMIALEEMFLGTINCAPVYPREVARRCLELGANSTILVHCHPAGDPTPSQPDKVITEHIRKALQMFDIRVLDHIVVGAEGWTSFAEKGWL